MLFKMSNEGERKTQGKKKCAHKTHPHTFANVYSIKKRTKSKIPATTKTRATKNKQQINEEKKQQQQQKALIYITKIIIFHSPIVLKKITTTAAAAAAATATVAAGKCLAFQCKNKNRIFRYVHGEQYIIAFVMCLPIYM